MPLDRNTAIGVLVALSVAMQLHTGIASERPNIVFILADDLGYGDVKAFGGEKCNVDTPNFDQLCAEGMKFTDAHVTDSVCVPSRTSIMTGRYAFRFGKAERVDLGDSLVCGSPSHSTLWETCSGRAVTPQAT